jgi:hypothetical protein
MHLVPAPTVELLRDPWGIPHVFAAAESDGFCGLGKVTLPQVMELVRQRHENLQTKQAR